MPIVGGLDIHRKQLTFDYLDTVTGEVKRGQIAPADRGHLRAWLERFAGRDDAAFAMEGCTGWRYVAEELTAAGVAAHVAEPADTAAARGRKRHPKTAATAGAPRPLTRSLAEPQLSGTESRSVLPGTRTASDPKPQNRSGCIYGPMQVRRLCASAPSAVRSRYVTNEALGRLLLRASHALISIDPGHHRQCRRFLMNVAEESATTQRTDSGQIPTPLITRSTATPATPRPPGCPACTTSGG